MKNYEMLNKLIKDMGFEGVGFRYCNDGSIYFFIYRNVNGNLFSYQLYDWDNDEEIIEGNISKKNIFEFCRRFNELMDFNYRQSLVDYKFLEFMSECNSLEEIKLKMQLIGL
jgi:hypothetical protein